MTTEAGTTTVTTSYALSKEGPHHVELGQSIEGTLWTTPTPGHAHHVGYWVDDVVAASRALDQGGSPRVDHRHQRRCGAHVRLPPDHPRPLRRGREPRPAPRAPARARRTTPAHIPPHHPEAAPPGEPSYKPPPH